MISEDRMRKLNEWTRKIMIEHAMNIDYLTIMETAVDGNVGKITDEETWFVLDQIEISTVTVVFPGEDIATKE